MRERIESAFAGLATWISGHRLVTLLLALALLAGTTLPAASRLRFEGKMVTMFHPQDPARLAYERFQQLFGRDDVLIVMLAPRGEGASVFEPRFLAALQRLHEALERRVPHVAKVTSLVNARHTRGEQGRLVVEKLMRRLPRTPAELGAFRNKVLGNPLYRDLVVSRDGRATGIVIEPAATRPDPKGGDPLPVDVAEHTEIYREVRALTAPLKGRGVTVHLAGHPVINTVLQEAVQQDIRLLTPLSMALSMLLLALLFRRVTGVIYPLVVVVAALASTVGTMALLGLPFTNISSALPSFLIVVGIADAVHILALYYRRIDGDGGDRTAAMTHAFAHSGLPVLMTSLTTAAGLASFATADVTWVAEFGLAAPIGVGFALLYTLLLLPALLALTPARPRRRGAGAPRTSRTDRLLVATGDLATRRPWWVVAAWTLVFVGSAAGIARLRISQNGIRWFPEQHPLRVATSAIDRQLGGSLTFEVALDTGKKDGAHDAKLIAELDRSVALLERYRRGPARVGKAIALSTLIKEIHRAINDNRADHYRVPKQSAAIAQELLLFEMSDGEDLEDLVTTDLRFLRLTLTVPFADAIAYVPMLADLKRHFAERYPSTRVDITGMQVLFIETIDRVLHSVARSYPIALGIVSLLMVLMLGRLRIGLLSMVPNLVPILIVTGWMGWLEIPFDFSTMLIGSLAIGLVVDDTIHFLHGYVREQRAGRSVREAVRATMLSTGRAILVTSVTLAGGFFIYCAASLKNLLYFGTLIGSIVLLALLADLLLVPALLSLGDRPDAQPGAGTDAV